LWVPKRLQNKAYLPIAVLWDPDELNKVPIPIAVLKDPVVLKRKVEGPIAML